MIRWLKSLFKKPKELKIWGIIEGPIRAEDIPESDFPEGSVGMVLKVQSGVEVFDAEFWFDSFDEAYLVIKHFQETIEPLNMSMEGFENVR